MALKAIVDDINSVDEAFREHYAERNGVWHLDIEDFGKHPGAVTLKGTADKLNRDKVELNKKIGELQAKADLLPDDFDAEEYATLKASGGTGDKDKDIEAARAALREQNQKQLDALKAKHQTEKAEIEAKLKERDSYIDTLLIDGKLNEALLDAGVNPDLLDGAHAALRSKVRVEVNESTNERSAVATTDLGDVSVKDFVSEWAKSTGKAYIGKASGADAKGNDRKSSGAGVNKGKIDGTPEERVKYMAEKYGLPES